MFEQFQFKKYFTFIVCFFLFGSSTMIVGDVKGLNQKDESFDYSSNIMEMISKFNESLVYDYHIGLMSFGPRYTGSENCSKAGDWIYSEFMDLGLDVEFHHWNYDGYTSRNVVATIPGYNLDQPTEYIISAHYDCTPESLGADDDGSGIAAILAIASVMSSYSYPYTIKFIAFTGEEVGTYGSYSYAKDAYRRGDNIRAIINPDMIGYANSSEGGKILRFFYPPRSKWIGLFAQNVSEKYNDLYDMYVEVLPNYIGSDHQAFVDYGYDGVWIAHHDSYPWANSPNDTPENINFTYLIKSTKLLLSVMAEFAYQPVPVQVMIKTPYEGYGYLFEKPIIPLNLGDQWYNGLRGITVLIGSTYASAEVYSDSAIEYIIFCVNGNFINWDSTPPYEWKIQGKHFPLIGRHKLQVFAQTENGDIATDEMDIFIISIKCQYSRW
jgi:hypothetical protein